MRIQFLGTGEAFDEEIPNTSLLITAGETTALLDVGFTAAPAFFRFVKTPRTLDAVFLTHLHGDHFFGLPFLLARFKEEGRTAPLAIFGPVGVETAVLACLDLAYPGLRAKLPFSLSISPLHPGDDLFFRDFTVKTAPTDHAALNLAHRFESDGKALFVSGDGAPTAASAFLAHGVNLLVHEAHGLDDAAPGHCSIRRATELFRESGAKRLALVHIGRDNLRRKEVLLSAAVSRMTVDAPVFFPQPGDAVVL